MTETSLRFASDILRRLGEELNPSPDQGIVELAKNSYDADALACTIRLDNITDTGGTLTVEDDGDGMDLEEIEDGWLVLGRSDKSSAKLTRRGRIPAGNKGLGRLAALRLGQEVQLTTRPHAKPERQYSVSINWADFAGDTLVESVPLRVVSRRRAHGATDGTTITIRNLTRSLGRMDVKRLARSLILLGDPFGEDPDAFTPTLESADFADLAELVSNRYFDDADYHLIAAIDSDGQASARVLDWRGSELFSADHAQLRRKRKAERFELPPVSFDLWAFQLTSEAFSPRSVTLGEVKDWLETFGGVHLYLNGLRVAPYGNPGDDWLGLNVSRVRSPEERPSTNNSLGRVSIVDREGLLAQKTDRSGLIEDTHFEQLRTFGQEALNWMARRRLQLAEQRRQAARTHTAETTSDSKRKVRDKIDSLPEDVREDVDSSFRKYDRERDRREAQLRKEVQLYRTLATAGITAATFAHESAGNPLKVITQATSTIERRGKKALNGDYPQKLERPVAALRNATRTLGVLSSVTLGLISSDRRRAGRVDLHPVIRRTIDTFEPFTSGRDVEIDLQIAGRGPFLRGSEAAIESIVANLLNNSLAAFERAETHPRNILVRSETIDDTFVLRVSDNGPGIQGISLDDIWLPGESANEGTGLGLTIVRDAVLDLGGNATATPKGGLGGAEFAIELPVLGSS